MLLPSRPQPDTNLLIHYARGSDVARRIEANAGLTEVTAAPVVACISVGEVEMFARRNLWGEPRIERMRAFLSGMAIVWIERQEFVDAYVDIKHYCETRGRQLSHNDLWIAATATVSGSTVLTTDGDFDPLHNVFFPRVRFNAMTGEVAAS